MKTIIALLVAGFLATAAHAQSLLLSDFSSSHFAVDSYISALDGPWSNNTASYGATSFTIGNFGSGAPSGRSGNGFMQYLGDTPQNWSSYTSIEFKGTSLPANGTALLSFYMEDVQGGTSWTTFTTADFVGGATVTLALNKAGIDITKLAYWGFAVGDANSPAPAFAFEFDNAMLVGASAVPEPSTYALMVGGVVLAGAVIRRRRQNRG